MIRLYWWEGYCGYQRAFARLLKGKSFYVSNFGDQLSPFVVSLLAPHPVRHAIGEGKLLSVGSVFFSLRNKDSVWGSGLLNAKHIKFALACEQVNYLAVRGPKTRDLLLTQGIECPPIYGDPALLLPWLVKNDIEKRYRIGIVPHFYHAKAMKEIVKLDESIRIIDVEKPFYTVMREILSCDVILSSSLHGLIVAESYGIPALLLTLGNPLHGDYFKFEDYFHSTNRSLALAQFSSESNLSNLAEKAMSQEKPSINLQGLLQAFPYATTLQLETQNPVLSWSDKVINRYRYRSSLRPPYLFVPKNE